jgi:5-(carboxyamino)imidazole ribonucleotide synthase
VTTGDVIGVLGGGQLARLLLAEGALSGLEVKAYCQSELDPAFPIHRDNEIGSLQDPGALRKFLSNCSAVTFESEFVDVEALRPFEMNGLRFFPSLDLIQRLQDRLTQKRLLEKYRIPTTSFWHLKDLGEAEALLKKKGALVAKRRRNGYDGYGTFHIQSLADLKTLAGAGTMEEFIFEERVKFRRELAGMAFRQQDGSSGSLPFVEWQAKDSRCFWVKGPLKAKDPAVRKMNAVTRGLTRMMNAEGYVGVLAFEMFDWKGKVIVNEVAPRVHNSMHHSLDSLKQSQFHIHLSCATNEPLGKDLQTALSPFAMVNLLGRPQPGPKAPAAMGSQLYWYGKHDERPGRKMGHVTALGSSPDAALGVALKAERQWRAG